jgi:hypothetical protein
VSKRDRYAPHPKAKEVVIEVPPAPYRPCSIGLLASLPPFLR